MVPKKLIYDLAGIDYTIARAIIGTGRASDQLSKAEDLLTALGLSPNPPLTELKKSLEDLEKARDSYAHGVWAKNEKDELGIQDYSGKWDLGPRTPRTTKRMYPGFKTVDRAALDELSLRIETAIVAIDNFHDATMKILAPLRGKSPLPAPPNHQTDDQIQSHETPEPQPESSQESPLRPADRS